MALTRSITISYEVDGAKSSDAKSQDDKAFNLAMHKRKVRKKSLGSRTCVVNGTTTTNGTVLKSAMESESKRFFTSELSGEAMI